MTQLEQVEDRPGDVDPVEFKEPDHLLQAELLLALGVRVAEQGEEVEQRLGEETLLLIPLERGRVLALADLRLVGVAQQADVDVFGRREAELLVEPDVLGQRVEPLLGADDMADAHEVVVDHRREVVGRPAIALEQNLVIDVPPRLHHRLLAQTVAVNELAVERRLHPHDIRFAGIGARLRLGRVVAAVTPVVHDRLVVRPLALLHLLQLTGGGEAVVRIALGDELVGVFPVEAELHSLALNVRPTVATHIWAFVVLQSQPLHRGVDVLRRFLGAAGLVGILDPQDELAAMGLGEAIIHQAYIGRANMRVAGGRRSNADADSHGGSILDRKTAAEGAPAGASFAKVECLESLY